MTRERRSAGRTRGQSRRSSRVPGRARAAGRVALRLFAILAFAAVGVGAGYLGVQLRQALQTGEMLAIESIRVEGLQQVSEDELMAYAGLQIGDGLYAFDSDEIEAALAEHPLVRRARLVRRPPHELRVFATEERPVAYVALEHLYAVNPQGKCFARAEALAGLELPVVTGVDPELLEQGPEVSGLHTALGVLAAWDRAGFKRDELAEIHVNPALGVDLVLSGGKRHVHLGVRRIADKLQQLAQLRAAFEQRGQRATHIFMTDGPDPRRVVVRHLPTRTAASARQPG